MRKLNHILNHIEEYFTAISLFSISILVFVQAVLRYGFSSSLSWSDEVARYMIVWVVFVGSSIAVREKAHASVDAVTTFLPALMQRIFSIVVNILGLIFCVITIWAGYGLVTNAIDYDTVTATIGISMAFPYLAIPVGASLMFIRFMQLLFKDIRSIILKDYEKTSLTEEATKY